MSKKRKFFIFHQIVVPQNPHASTRRDGNCTSVCIVVVHTPGSSCAPSQPSGELESIRCEYRALYKGSSSSSSSSLHLYVTTTTKKNQKTFLNKNKNKIIHLEKNIIRHFARVNTAIN